MNTPNPCISLPIIGYHHSPLKQKFGTPRQPNLVNVESYIQFLPPYHTPDAFVGIENYSHLWVMWQFHHNKTQAHFRPQVRPPRLGGNDKIGVFATRSMYRPSQLGLSVVRLSGVSTDKNGVILHILGADMIDGTPIVDVKPYVAYSDSIHDAICVMEGDEINTPTVKHTHFSKDVMRDIALFLANGKLTEGDVANIKSLVAQDPRPAYRQNEVNIACVMQYGCVDVGFVMNDMGEMVINAVVLIV